MGDDHGHDLMDEDVSAAVLGYGTHDRAGPWWLRWSRACWRAARPALIATAIAAALAYSVAPRQYTAVTIVSVEPDVISASRAMTLSPQALAARADAFVQSLKQTDYLQQVLDSPEWRSASASYLGKTAFDPIDGERIPGTNKVRIRFTDSNAQRARAGAEAAVTVLHPINDPDSEDPAVIVDRTLEPLLQQQRQIAKWSAAMREREPSAATRPSTRQPTQLLSNATSARGVQQPGFQSAASYNRQLAMAESNLAMAERKLASAPRVKRIERATTPRFASNQKDLLSAALSATGIVFPLAFIAALYHAWRYRGAATAQVTAGDRIMSVADLATLMLRSPARRRWSAAMVPALGPAAGMALIAAVIACSLAPRRYTATATVTAAPALPALPPVSSAKMSIATRDALAALAAAADTVEVVGQVVESPQWKLARGSDTVFTNTSSLDVESDAQHVTITFTDADRDAARYAADAIMTAARDAVRPLRVNPRAPAGRVQPLRGISPASRWRSMPASERARQDAIGVAIGQLPAAVVSVSRHPTNSGEIAAAANTPAMQAFGVTYVLAMVWFFKRPGGRESPADDLPRRAAAAIARVPWQLAASLALVVGLVAYTVAPRTYSATAVLRIRMPAPGSTPSTLTPAEVVRGIADTVPKVAGVACTLDVDAREIQITCTATDPRSAGGLANSAARSLSTRWLDQIFRTFTNPNGPRSALLRAPPSQDLRARDELNAWTALSGSMRVDVVQAAGRPRWADQSGPVHTAALGTVFAFAVLLPTVTLGRAARRRWVHRGMVSPATAPRAGDARFVPA